MNIICSYKAKWQLRINPNYKWTECKKLINCKTGREIKRTIKGNQAGYWIGKRFIKLSEMKSMVEVIKSIENLPF